MSGTSNNAPRVRYVNNADPASTAGSGIGDGVAGLTQIQLGRQVHHLHQLGERALLELFIEFVGIDDNLLFDLQVLLDRYANLTPEMIDRLDAREIRDDLIVIDGGRR